ncbi:hypothetical protein FEM48_Zijuj02G0005700 [Ziziphus jujuba var. spinosa]|uniref:Uncharacterized protein n=1 Tax=Ziziphus jujuba var. spinosa TaxID=714518 RepID=A0A978VSK2_ZIZJJ|nr:hypothetical protein FEM48_Zijuj02G0005700 [Ziziphus jujuba var. spinosa]
MQETQEPRNGSVRKVVSYSSSSTLGGGVGAYLNKYGQTTVATAYLLLHSSPLPRNLGRISTSQSSLPNPTISFPSSTNPHFLFLPRSDIAHKLQSAFSGSGSGYGGGGGGGFINACSSSGGGGDDGYNDDEQRALFQVLGYLGRVLSGWFFRWIVTGDIQFPFVLLIKELVGGTAFFVLERVWTALSAQLQLYMEGFLKAISEGIVMMLLFPLLLPLLMVGAMIDVAVAGIASFFLFAIAASVFATSLYGLYCVIDWMWPHW